MKALHKLATRMFMGSNDASNDQLTRAASSVLTGCTTNGPRTSTGRSTATSTASNAAAASSARQKQPEHQ